MNKRMIMPIIMLTVLLTSCNNNGENKASLKANSQINTSSNVNLPDNKVATKENDKAVNKSRIEENNTVSNDNIIKELKKGKFEYTKTTKKIVKPNKESIFEGYSDNHIYFSSTKKHDEMRDGGLCDTTYYITDENGSREVYKINNHFYGLFNGMYEGDLIIAVTGGLDKEDDAMNAYTIHRIGKNGGEIICKTTGKGIYETQIIGDSLVYYTTDNEKGEGVLTEYNLKTKKTTEIVKHSYKVGENGTFVKGKTVFALDGFNDGVVFRVEIADKEEKDIGEGRKWENWYYDFKEKTLTELPINYERMASYIGGDKDCVIIGDLDMDNDIDNTGTMYLRKEDGSYTAITLPKIVRFDDARKSVRISENIIALTAGSECCLIDYKKGIYEVINGYGRLEKGRIITEKNNKVRIYENIK